MGKITGMEKINDLPEKVLLLYKAVGDLVGEGADVANLKVSDITERAGIGKGTAYDYFESKEEMIVYALLFFIENSMEDFINRIREKKSFSERLEFALDSMEKEGKERKIVLRFINMFFDSTQMGQQLRNIIEKRKSEACMPLNFGIDIVERGIKDGELRADLPTSYMTYTLITRVVAYIAYLVSPGEKECSNEEFRRCIYQGIMDEMQAR